MKKVLLTYVCLLLASLAIGQVSKQEKQVLLDLYNATNGPQWKTTWDTESPVATWHGITVENNSVTGISLLFNNLDGTLPASLGKLQSLKKLELSFNQISGAIPAELGNLSHLEVLALNGDQLEGNIPETLGNLYNLKQLHLSSNKLSGNVPKNLENLKQIEIFNVFDNNLYGALPKGLANCPHLTQLIVAENNFSNPDDFSVALLSNSGSTINLHSPQIGSQGSIIAIETDDSDD
jgi:hypothetical protein